MEYSKARVSTAASHTAGRMIYEANVFRIST